MHEDYFINMQSYQGNTIQRPPLPPTPVSPNGMTSPVMQTATASDDLDLLERNRARLAYLYKEVDREIVEKRQNGGMINFKFIFCAKH